MLFEGKLLGAAHTYTTGRGGMAVMFYPLRMESIYTNYVEFSDQDIYIFSMVY